MRGWWEKLTKLAGTENLERWRVSLGSIRIWTEERALLSVRETGRVTPVWAKEEEEKEAGAVPLERRWLKVVAEAAVKEAAARVVAKGAAEAAAVAETVAARVVAKGAAEAAAVEEVVVASGAYPSGLPEGKRVVAATAAAAVEVAA